MLELQLTGYLRHPPRGRKMVGGLFVRVEEFEHPPRRGHAGLQHVHLTGDLGQRHRELTRVLDEGLHVSERQRPGSKHVAEHRHHDVVDVGEELHRRLDHSGQELSVEARFVQPPVLAAELVDRGGAPAEQLEQRMSGVGLLDQPLDPTISRS